MGKLGSNVHTIYDRLDATGAFDGNAANVQSRDKLTGEALYKGPVQFPCMLYHPKGEKRQLSPAVPGQAAQHEIINKIVKDKNELVIALKAGWHEHPADALKASGMDESLLPAKGSVDRVAQLERQIASQTAEINKLRAGGSLQNDNPDDEEEEG